MLSYPLNAIEKALHSTGSLTGQSSQPEIGQHVVATADSFTGEDNLTSALTSAQVVSLSAPCWLLSLSR